MAGTERMTDRARRVIAIAEQQARRRGAMEVEPESLLLALALEGSGLAARVLQNLGVTAEQLSRELPISSSVPAGNTELVPLSSITEHVIAHAHAELIQLRHNYVGTEHLLLAVVQVKSGAVPALLSRLGVTCEGVRREAYDILGHGL